MKQFSFSTGLWQLTSFFFFFSFFPPKLCQVACRILVPQPVIEPMAPAVKGPSFKHWTASKEVPQRIFYILEMNLLTFLLGFFYFIAVCADFL